VYLVCRLPGVSGGRLRCTSWCQPPVDRRCRCQFLRYRSRPIARHCTNGLSSYLYRGGVQRPWRRGRNKHGVSYRHVLVLDEDGGTPVSFVRANVMGRPRKGTRCSGRRPHGHTSPRSYFNDQICTVWRIPNRIVPTRSDVQRKI
jgi:hypothetical protein